MKKIIIICAFSLLIFITAVLFINGAITSYRYDMNPDNGIDIMQGFGAALVIVVGGFVVFYELDLFYTVYYFFVKPKTLAKSILNIASNASLLLILAYGYLSDVYMELRAYEITPYILFFIYVVLRLVYCVISIASLREQ